MLATTRPLKKRWCKFWVRQNVRHGTTAEVSGLLTVFWQSLDSHQRRQTIFQIWNTVKLTSFWNPKRDLQDFMHLTQETLFSQRQVFFCFLKSPLVRYHSTIIQICPLSCAWGNRPVSFSNRKGPQKMAPGALQLKSSCTNLSWWNPLVFSWGFFASCQMLISNWFCKPEILSPTAGHPQSCLLLPGLALEHWLSLKNWVNFFLHVCHSS